MIFQNVYIYLYITKIYEKKNRISFTLYEIFHILPLAIDSKTYLIFHDSLEELANLILIL